MNTITIENARIGFRNFSGEEGKFNPKGKRNFCVFLETDIVEELKADGWNVRELPPREEGDTPQAYLQVAVSYDNIPPSIFMVASNGKRRISEETVNILDWVDIEYTDLIIAPYQWEVNGRSGVKAYLRTMYVKMREDELTKKYVDVPSAPDSAMNSFTEK